MVSVVMGTRSGGKGANGPFPATPALDAMGVAHRGPEWASIRTGRRSPGPICGKGSPPSAQGSPPPAPYSTGSGASSDVSRGAAGFPANAPGRSSRKETIVATIPTMMRRIWSHVGAPRMARPAK